MSRIDWTYLAADTAADSGWSHSGIAITDAGVVIFAEPSGGGLILLHRDPDGGAPSVDRVVVPLLEIHGIFYSHTDRGEVLWLADPGFKARRELGYETESAPGQAGSLDLTTLEFVPLQEPPLAANGRGWEPTSVIATRAADGTDLAIVADGYGASLVHFYSNGTLIRTIDGRDSGTVFACPHGLVIDDRGAQRRLVVADRGNRRLVVFELDGSFVRTIVDPLFTSPSSLALRGDELLVTELDGALLAVSADDSVRALIDTRSDRGRDGWPNHAVSDTLIRPQLELGTLNSPHGLAVARDGRIYLTEWVIGGRQLELTLNGDPSID